MFEGVLRQFRQKVRTRRYVVTGHADEEMDEDGLSIFDVEGAVLTGTIIERQRDHQTGERKYVVRGEAVDGTIVGVVGKLSPTGRLVIITAYRE
jgi:uncharacterized DUF497 family protein